MNKVKSFFLLLFKPLWPINRLSVSIALIGLSFAVLTSCSSGLKATGKEQEAKWVGTWATAPQLVEPRNLPPAPGLENNTLRQIVAVSIGGERLRLKFSNEFSETPVEIKGVQIAASNAEGSIFVNTSKALTFNGNSEAVIPAGGTITSDPVAFDLDPRMRLAITTSFGETAPDVTGHPGSRTTSYLLEGSKLSPAADFSNAVTTDHWYLINKIEVEAPESAAAIAILGNSITDGRGSGTNKQNRWPDILAQRLLEEPRTQNIGVLNMGIGGNAVLRGGLGPTGLDRFERDILDHDEVRWVIIMEGVNDLGATKDSLAAFQVAGELIAAYDKMIKKARARDMKVYGGTITPIKGSFYYESFREKARAKLNDWIRNSGKFDAVIDFDRVLRDPDDQLMLLPEAHTGDHLHPNELGYEMMGKSIDLSLFSSEATENE